MKKVSTVAVKQSRNISQPKLTIGLDLGDRNSWYCLVDEPNRWQHRLKRERPTCTERNQSLLECGWKHGDSGHSAGEKPCPPKKHRTYLTPTGLLMEGDYTNNPTPGRFGC